MSVIRAMLKGDIDLLYGCRRLVRLQHLVRETHSEAWLTIVGIESETDDLPLGDQKLPWSPDMLKEKEREAKAYLDKVEPILLKACQELLARFENE